MKSPILDHYGFSRLPFGKDLSTEHMFPTATVEDTTAMIEFGLATEDIILVTGPIGCGKSLALRRVTARLDTNRYQIMYLPGSIGSQAELYKQVLTGMKIDPPHSLSKAKPKFYSAVSEAGRKPVVILDDAQDIPENALLALKSMTNFEFDSANRITIVLVGQPELTKILGYSHFDSLRARIRLSTSMTGMSLSETCDYIDHQLKIVKREQKLFSDNAKAEVFKRTQGIPRAVNNLCFKAVLQGAVKKTDIIDVADIPQDGV